MVLFHEALPGAYLLVLAPDPNATALTDGGLAKHLDQACRSGQPVWVDCRLMDTVSATAAWLLWACSRRLRRQRLALVLCRVSQRVEGVLREAFHGAELCLAASLDECAQPSAPAMGPAA